MSNITLDYPVTSAQVRKSLPPSSFGRLLKVEARKLVDTRAGFWLILSGVVLTVAALIVTAVLSQLPEVRGPDTVLTWFTVSSTSSILSIFLGVLAILTMTTEWTTRTALTTFTLEPRRLRVAAAKMLVLALATLVMILFSVVVGAVVIAVLKATGGNVNWSMPLGELGAFTVQTLFNTFMAAGFALLMANTAAAIVAYFALPMAAGVLVSFGDIMPNLGKVAPWIAFQPSLSALSAGPMTGVQWAQLAVVVLLCIGIPTAIGLVLWQRRQVS